MSRITLCDGGYETRSAYGTPSCRETASTSASSFSAPISRRILPIGLPVSRWRLIASASCSREIRRSSTSTSPSGFDPAGIVPSPLVGADAPRPLMASQVLSACASGRFTPAGGLDDDPEEFLERRLALEDLQDPVLPEREHPLLLGDSADVLARLSLDGHPLDVFAHQHDLVYGHAPSVARIAARVTAGRPV